MGKCPKCGKKTTSWLELEYCDTCYTEEDLNPYKLLGEIGLLKQQLAEKEKEKEKEIDERMMAFEKSCQEYYKSKEFTIEQLEKVKTQCEFSITFASDEQEQRLYAFIDQQIKELKEGKQNVK